jgi:hypothetical protein
MTDFKVTGEDGQTDAGLLSRISRPDLPDISVDLVPI